MRSDGKKATLLFLGNYAVLYPVRPCPVRMEFFSKLFLFSGTDIDGVQFGGLFSAAMVSQGLTAGTGDIAGKQSR